MLKCLVCYSDLPSAFQKLVKSEDDITTGQKTLLAKHLDVIFILRNIFQVPVTQLSNYLKNCPNVDGWTCICEKCDDLVGGFRAIYNDMVEISRKIEDVKGGTIGIVRKSYDKPSLEETQTDPGFLNITDECRKFINYHEYQWPVNPFTDGDLNAAQLLNEPNGSIANDDDQNKSGAVSKRSRTRDLTFTTTTSPPTCSYPPNDDEPLSYDNDDDYFEHDDDFNEDDNQDDEDDDEEESIINYPRNSYKRSHYKETSKEWKAPTHLKYQRKSPQEKVECPICRPTQIFPNITQLGLHFKDNHPNELPPKQRKYPAQFYTISDSRKRRIRTKVPGQCPHCSKEFGSQDNLKTHIRFTHLHQFSFHCSKCGVGRSTKKILESHEANCSKMVPPEKCPEEGCPVIVTVKVGLETHFRDSHPERTLFSRCPECEEGFYTKSGLERHLQKFHKETRPFKCGVCWMGFKTSQDKYMHKRRCHEGKGEKVICDHCGATFASQNYLNEHVKMQHENEFKLRCDQCGRGFAKAELWKVHLYKKHGIGRVEDLKWRCGVETCGKVFWTKDTLTAHVSLHHDEGKVPEFTCEECGKQFHRKAGLVYHRKGIHESKLNKEKFKCEICGGEFGFKDYLTRHKRTVHKIFPQRRK